MFYSSYIDPRLSSSPLPSSSLPLSFSLPPSSFLPPSSLSSRPSSLTPPPSSFLPSFQSHIDPSSGKVYLRVTIASCPEELIAILPERAALNHPGLLSIHGFKRINSNLDIYFEHAIPLSSSLLPPSSSSLLLSVSLLLQASSLLRQKGITPNFSELFLVKDGSLRIADLGLVGVRRQEEWMNGGGEGEKGDVFKLGGKMMEWVGLIKASEIWDYDLKKWNNRLLVPILDKIASDYGESYRDLISEMIEENQTLRLDVKTAQKMIKTIEEIISPSLPPPSYLPPSSSPSPSYHPDEFEIETIMRKMVSTSASSNFPPPSSPLPPPPSSLIPPSLPHYPPSLYSDTSPRSSKPSSFIGTPKGYQKPSTIIPPPSSPPLSSTFLPPPTFIPSSSLPPQTSLFPPPFSYYPPPSSSFPPPPSSTFPPFSSFSPLPSSYPPPFSSFPPPSSSLPPLYHPPSPSPSNGIKRAVYQTPEKSDILSKIHKVTPGSLGKSSIKIVYTPSKSTAEKMKQLDQEFESNKEKIAAERKSSERSYQVLKSTVEFLRNTPVSTKKRE